MLSYLWMGTTKKKQCYISAKRTKMAITTTKKNHNGNDVQDSPDVITLSIVVVKIRNIIKVNQNGPTNEWTNETQYHLHVLVYNCFIFIVIIVFKSYWEMLFCLFLVAKASVPSIILTNWYAVLSCQIDVPYVYKPLAVWNLRECFKVSIQQKL